MPRTSANQRQKNKPFKGKNQKASKKSNKQASTKTKPIAKANSLRKIKNTRTQILQNKKNKKSREIAKIAEKNQYLDSNTKSFVVQKLKNQSELRIVLLLPGNRQANTQKILQDIYNTLKDKDIAMETNSLNMPYQSLLILPPSHQSFIKNKILIISGTSNNFNIQNATQMPSIPSLIDLIKCSDIVCPVLSCASTNVQMINLDPHQAGGAFDELGYLLINTMRSLGTPSIFSIVQQIQNHDKRHHDKIQRLFKRFITSQLGDQNDKISFLKGTLNDYNKALRTIDSISIKKQSWKSERGYILVDQIKKQQTGNLTFSGYLKGNCVNANQLAHITGFEDYEIQKIQIIDSKKRKDANLVQFSSNPESLFPFSKQDTRDQDLMTAFEGLKLNIQNKKQQMQNQQADDFIDEEDSQQNQDDAKYDLQNFIQNNQKEQEKQLRHVQMQMRTQDELQFEDQVQYAAQEVLRQKYAEYQGLKNFKSSQWNHLQNLPEQYDRIYTFKHYLRTHHAVSNQNQTKAFAYPGFYISVTLKNVDENKLLEHVKQNPTIITFLLKHEHKMTQLHLKVRRNPYYPSNINDVVSNEKYFISMGFRRILVAPIFSRIIQGTDKTKYTKNIKQDYQSYYFCSFYHYNYFPPAPVHIYRINQINTSDMEPSPIMYGQLAKVDPLHCILERIILTGYPFKINKRRSTIRFMFFNPKDVKYFKPVEVRTKMGLKGRIEESLGTHGHMKVLFSDKIKHNDTVCMYLYRRVYPSPWF